MTDLLTEKPHRTWTESVKAFMSPKVLALLFLGFSAGVPIYLVFSTLSIWLREAGIERATIGFFSWAALAYGFKFIWAPLIDKLPVPGLAKIMGRRRAWLLVAQVAIVGSLSFMASVDPVHNLMTMAVGAVLLAFSSATQDIVIDAYRIESSDDDLQGLLSATYIAGYRLGMLVAGAGALEIAGFLDTVDGYEYAAWQGTYFAMAAVMVIGVITTFMISEPVTKAPMDEAMESASDYLKFMALFVIIAGTFVGVFQFLPHDAFGVAFFDGGLRVVGAALGAVGVGMGGVKFGLVRRAVAYEAYVAPFADFFKRFGTVAILILALIATFRIADIVMGVMANVFYVDLGFEKQDIGRISKGFGLAATLVGGFMGGVLTLRYGVMKILFLGGFLAATTNVLFAGLSTLGPQIWVLMAVISADNLAGGIASAAFVAYLSGLTSRNFTATQYALFSSLMMLVPKLIAGYSGVVVDSIGYMPFFLSTAALGMIPLVLIPLVAKFSANLE